MNRLARISILWAIVALASFRSTAVANAISIDDNNDTDKLDTLLDQQDNRLSENHDDGASNPFGVIDGEEPSVEKVVDNNEDELLDAEAIRKKLRKNKITDILVACFFFVAAVWLVLATGYSIILLVLLRLQARGELDIYDENLGRVVLCNGKITLHFGCILRRYAIQLEEDYQRQLQRRTGDSNAENQEPQRIRIMTREERRKAIEELLGGAAKTFDVDSGCADDPKKCIGVRCEVITKSDASKKPSGSSCSDTSMTCSEEEPMCSICLGEYEPTDSVFRSKSCPHMFHGECLFSWLERRNNTECPCCREPLVSDDDVWKVVQRMRKERREELRRENGLMHRFVKWTKSKRNQQSEQSHPALFSVETDHTDNSGTSVSSGNDDESNLDQATESPSSTNSDSGENGVGNTDEHDETSPENNV